MQVKRPTDLSPQLLRGIPSQSGENSIKGIRAAPRGFACSGEGGLPLAGRHGGPGEVKMVADAKAVFENDETREEYDLLLLSAGGCEPQGRSIGAAVHGPIISAGDYGASGVAKQAGTRSEQQRRLPS